MTRLLAIGTAVPEQALPQEQAAAMAAPLCAGTPRQERALRAVYRRSGIDRRHSVLQPGQAEESGHGPVLGFYRNGPIRAAGGPSTADRMAAYEAQALPLAARAARSALEKAAVSASEIRHLVTVSCTGFAAPGVDLRLVEQLGLPASVSRTNLGFMGCHGALNGLRTAGALAASGGPALLVCVELCTLHFQYGWEAEQMTANALFADGAAAAVLAPGDVGSDGLRLRAHASHVFPASSHAMSWRIGDHGFRMGLTPQVPRLLRGAVRPWVEEWLRSDGKLDLRDVGLWALHPGGPRILDALEAALELAPEQAAPARHILRQYGNMSSPTVLFVLEEALQRGQQPPAVLLAFGPGLAAEGALLGG